ncbi:CLC_0170 family protein [Clostridium thermarum]|uniref:CLC_0170 family protein n=1 Tax=Clostridium thermarum TaxID=1716543 RepID=UPI00111EDD21|nr:CLC_0170 family protein [Clostridium thermarum]
MLGLFNEYFLALVILTSLVVIFKDGRQFNKEDRKGEARKAKFLGSVLIVLALLLYIAGKLR